MEKASGSRPGLKEYYALILVMASFGVLIAEVFLRYVAGSSMEWTDEISRLLLVWMTFTGIGLVILERKEIIAQVFTQWLSPQAKKNWSRSMDLLVLVFNIFLVIFGLQMTHFSWDIKTESLELPFSYFYVSIPLGAILAVYYLIRRLRTDATGRKKGAK
ncbi:MAG: transporter small permease [Deltaproteobacteria bacterium]|jgi:TRAP-type C4-dicarboxylate transport system permease small subunit|nr:transporter small permease [Deltaproteobacteria bacterium]